MIKYSQAFDGEWILPKQKGFKLVCCDCEVIHTVDFKIVNGQVQFRVKRNSRLTEQRRKKFKVSVKHGKESKI